MLRACASLHPVGCGRRSARVAAAMLLHTNAPGRPLDTIPPPASSILMALRITAFVLFVPQVSKMRQPMDKLDVIS